MVHISPQEALEIFGPGFPKGFTVKEMTIAQKEVLSAAGAARVLFMLNKISKLYRLEPSENTYELALAANGKSIQKGGLRELFNAYMGKRDTYMLERMAYLCNTDNCNIAVILGYEHLPELSWAQYQNPELPALNIIFNRINTIAMDTKPNNPLLSLGLYQPQMNSPVSLQVNQKASIKEKLKKPTIKASLSTQAIQPQFITNPEQQISGYSQQETITNGQSMPCSVFQRYPLESVPICQLIQLGFFFLHKAGKCSKPIYNTATLIYNSPFLENLATAQQQEAAAELKLRAAGSSLEAALHYFFNKEHTNGDECKKLQQRRFLADIINGNSEKDISDQFNHIASIENAGERTQQMTELLEKYVLQQINNARWDKVIAVDTGCEV